MEASSIRAIVAAADEFSGVVVVAVDGSPVFEEAFGYSSRRWLQPNTVETRFDCASVTKLFTAVGVLQLVGDGLLDLDTSIHDYVALEGTTIGRDVTLRHLLTHTSGIADDADEESGEDYADLWIDKPVYSVIETRDFLPQFAFKPPLARPGEQCRYCNVGFVLAGLAIERAAGGSYRDYVVERVFRRAGMADSGFFDRRDAAPNVAEGWDFEGGRWVENIFSYPPIGSPDGGAQVTGHDLVRFIHAIQRGELLTPELTELFLTPQAFHDENEERRIDYGFGLEFDSRRGERFAFYKEGMNHGASGIVEHFPARNTTIVVLSNSMYGAWPVVSGLVALADGRQAP